MTCALFRDLQDELQFVAACQVLSGVWGWVKMHTYEVFVIHMCHLQMYLSIFLQALSSNHGSF